MRPKTDMSLEERVEILEALVLPRPQIPVAPHSTHPDIGSPDREPKEVAAPEEPVPSNPN